MNALKNVLDTYKVVIVPQDSEDGPGFVARYEELGFSVRGVGATQAEAIAELEDLALDGFEDLSPSELPLPSARHPWASCTGRITLRMPKMLHAKVDRQAREQGVSLNQWICHILESATTTVAAGHEFGAVGDEVSELVGQLSATREALDQWSLDRRFAQPALAIWNRESAPRGRHELEYQLRIA